MLDKLDSARHPARQRFTARPYPPLPRPPDGPDPLTARRLVAAAWNDARADAEALDVDDPTVFSALLLAHALVGLGGDVLDAGAREARRRPV